MTEKKKDRKITWAKLCKWFSLKKLNRKYDFQMSHDETGSTMLKFRLNLLNLIWVILGVALLLIVITSIIIAFTPLREYIPGYTDTNLNREVYQLSLRADSLSREMRKKDVYFDNLKKIVEDYDFAADSALASINIYEPLPKGITDTITLKKSVQDSILRAEYESQNQYNLFGDDLRSTTKPATTVKNFFVPLNGSVITAFNPDGGHYGVDIVSEGDQIINAALDGTVVFSTWSINNGFCIGIQHRDSYFSVYKHNATLLKKEGEYVKAGEAIAILGQSGGSETFEHLHFELWHNGIAINPVEYMTINQPDGN
ncbi:MAG: M23 family metallopeptidase [Bacteroidales bacterium]|nr:M23 family metallopeptidase [Bacteroidales bacterium]